MGESDDTQESSFVIIYSEYGSNEGREKHLEDVCDKLNNHLLKKVDVFDGIYFGNLL